MRIIKSEPKGIALLLTLFVLSGALIVTLTAADIVFSGIKMNRILNNSGIAFFAAEAGLERALWEARTWEARGVANPLVAGPSDNIFYGTLSNNSAYSVNYTLNAEVVFKSIGFYRGVKRSVESRY